MRYSDIFERAHQTVSSNIFAMAKAARAGLSTEAKSAIDAWETVNWTGGALEQHIGANDAVAREIEAAFAPIRATLPPKVVLYRGIVKDGSYKGWDKALLQSWTSDRRTAELFAGLRHGSEWSSLLHDEITDDQINAAIAQYQRTGFVKFFNRYYVRNKEHPRYYNIYDRHKQFITDGDDLAHDLLRTQQDRAQSNREQHDRSHVFEEEIERERIIWVTNALNCKEFLVRR